MDTTGHPRLTFRKQITTLKVRAELPGVAKDDLHVSVKDNLLTLSGEKRQEESGRYAKLPTSRTTLWELPTEFHASTGSGDRRHQSRIRRRCADTLHSEAGSRKTNRGSDHNRILIRLP